MELMAEIAKRLADFQRDDLQWTISLAYATRRADSINAAKQILLNAESKFPNEAIINTISLATSVRPKTSKLQRVT
jgi:hypothetical protein